MFVQKLGDTNEIWNALDGVFACVVVDEATGEFLAARDPIGVCSFYWGRGKDGSTWFSSEMKALQTHCQTFDIFPPVSSGSSVLLLCSIILTAKELSEVSSAARTVASFFSVKKGLLTHATPSILVHRCEYEFNACMERRR